LAATCIEVGSAEESGVERFWRLRLAPSNGFQKSRLLGKIFQHHVSCVSTNLVNGTHSIALESTVLNELGVDTTVTGVVDVLHLISYDSCVPLIISNPLTSNIKPYWYGLVALPPVEATLTVTAWAAAAKAAVKKALDNILGNSIPQ